MLETLPCEILSDVAQWLPPADLQALSQVSSRFYSILIPLIYRTVNFRASSELALNLWNVESFFQLHRRSRDNFHLKFTRDLRISAPIQIARFNRCVYCNLVQSSGLVRNSGTLGPSNEARAHEQFLDDISRQVQCVLRNLTANLLQSFQWHLGTCIPGGLLDHSGTLVIEQTNLKHISLVTDGSCPHAGACVGGLSLFPRLKSIAWEGIQHELEFESLQKCIRRNRPHLISLSVGLATNTTNLDFYQSILGLPLSHALFPRGIFIDTTDYFPCLLSLALSKALLLHEIRPGLASAFGALQSLTLRNCQNDLLFLGSLSCSPKKVKLQSFHFSCDMLQEGNSDREARFLAEFLKSFKGLRHLHLKLCNFLDLSWIEQGIAHHRSTLETLVYHERGLQAIDDEGRFEETRDQQPTWALHLANAVNLLQISALALCVSPSVMRSILEPFPGTLSLRLLHLRFSGSERMHRNIRHEFISRLPQAQSWSSHDSIPGRSSDYSASMRASERSNNTILPEELLAWPYLEVDSTTSCSEGNESVQFAEWAFGPTGIDSLKVLAFGDLSYDGRYQNQQFLLRRRYQEEGQVSQKDKDRLCTGVKGPYFCVATIEELLLDGCITVEDSNFLSACPEDSLMDSPYA